LRRAVGKNLGPMARPVSSTVQPPKKKISRSNGPKNGITWRGVHGNCPVYSGGHSGEFWGDSVFISSPRFTKEPAFCCASIARSGQRSAGKRSWPRATRKRVGNNMASPSPVTDGKERLRPVLVPATMGGVRLSSGKELWSRNLAKGFTTNCFFHQLGFYGFQSAASTRAKTLRPRSCNANPVPEGLPRRHSTEKVQTASRFCYASIRATAKLNMENTTRPTDAVGRSAGSLQHSPFRREGKFKGPVEILLRGRVDYTTAPLSDKPVPKSGAAAGLNDRKRIPVADWCPRPGGGRMAWSLACGTETRPRTGQIKGRGQGLGYGGTTFAWANYKEFPADCVNAALL